MSKHTAIYCNTVCREVRTGDIFSVEHPPMPSFFKFQYVHRWEELKLIQILNLISWT